MSSFYILWIIYISSSREYFLSKQRGQICLKHFFFILLWKQKERERKEMRWKIFWQTMHTHCMCISFPCKNTGTEKKRANKEKIENSLKWQKKWILRSFHNFSSVFNSEPSDYQYILSIFQDSKGKRKYVLSMKYCQYLVTNRIFVEDFEILTIIDWLGTLLQAWHGIIAKYFG